MDVGDFVRYLGRVYVVLKISAGQVGISLSVGAQERVEWVPKDEVEKVPERKVEKLEGDRSEGDD